MGIPAGPEMARVRAEEARCSCRELGIEPPTQLGFRDGELGMSIGSPGSYLREVVRAIRRLLAELRPDAVITWGPEGGYGHPDHRLVGAVVTQVVQSGVKGAPTRLFYPALPADRLPRRPGDPIWAVTDPRFLTVRVPYDAVDLAATRRAFACHQSQFTDERREVLVNWLHETQGGRVYLRPWLGCRTTDDVFSPGPP